MELKTKKCILALTTRGLNDWNLNFIIDQVLDFNLGGLFIWKYEDLKNEHLKIIKDRHGSSESTRITPGKMTALAFTLNITWNTGPTAFLRGYGLEWDYE